MRPNERNSKRQSNNEDIDVGRFFELAEAERSNIRGLNVHELRDKLNNGNRGFELVGNLTINGIKMKTNMRFKNMTDFKSYIEKVDEKYYGEDVVYEGDVFQLNQPEFKPIKRSKFGKGSNHLFDIEEYVGTNCYIPTGNNCFVKCINYITEKDYTQQYLEFISEGGRRKNVMTLARIQPFCKKYEIDLGYFNGKEVWPRIDKERKRCLYTQKSFLLYLG